MLMQPWNPGPIKTGAPYMSRMENGMQTIQSRVDELITQMTPADKAGQLTQYFYFRLPPGAEPALDFDADEQPMMVESALRAGRAGSLLFVTDPAEINRLQRLAVEGNRLGIPVLFGFDVIHGLRTILPVPIAMAASWDLDVIERGQAVAAREARAVGIHWSFAPMVDIARDPRWGRIIEGAGEDPYLGAAVAVAQVRGFQGGELGAPDRIIAGPKHLAGYGGALGGRDYDEVNLSDSELWNVYFPPFKAAVEAGAGNVMTAYMGLNGIPAAGSRWLFTEVLRDTWGFEGFVVSDANVVRNLVTHGFAVDLSDAAARAINAGVDMEMAVKDPAYTHLPEAVESGAASQQAMDASVRRVLEAKVRMAYSTHRTSMRTTPRRSSPTPHTETSLALPPSGRRYSSATRAAFCRWMPAASVRSRSSGHWPTPSATPSGHGSSTTTWMRR
jgi:beta-glucosidase